MVDGRSAYQLEHYLLWWLERQQTRIMLGHFDTALADVPTEPWMDDGACTQAINPDAWFPPRPNSVPPETALAIKVCRTRCPVQAQCLRYALAHPVQGVWGGTTEGQRARLAKQEAQQ